MAQAVRAYLPTAPEGIEDLIELALDLRGTWEHAADKLWGQLDPELWTLTLNPQAVLQTVSHARLKVLAADPAFRQKAAALVRARRHYFEAPTWFRRCHTEAQLTCVAYFSMEFMLSEALSIYSGELGNIASDQLKAASDLGVPVIGLNEGHAAFAVLERARSFMEDNGVSFGVALAVTRAGNLFTTHTPVEAGFDRFPPALIAQHLDSYARHALGIGLEALLALGRAHPHDFHEPFNMAYLAMRGSGAINGVSRYLFRHLFPRWPEGEVPVGSVTNGIHTQSQTSAAAGQLWAGVCGHERLQGTMEQGTIGTVAGTPMADVEQTQQLFDPNTLALGFARRFAAYKRPGLLLHDPERLLRLLINPEHPVQLIIAGKAHPQDLAGPAMVQAWVRFSQRPEARQHVVFLSDYAMLLAAHLVQGVDVWINNPRRPWEASGTSGMKVLVNGGLNLSELDGWWAEAYTPEVGWALGDGQEHDDDLVWDAAEAEALYTLLEQEVVSAFYTRDANGIPTAWVARMRESTAQLVARFSANRTVRDYAGKYYVPAAAAYRQRAASRGMVGEHIVDWQRAVAHHWAAVRSGAPQVETAADQHVFQIPVYVGELDPDAVRVELYADPVNGGTPLRQMMTRGAPLADATNGDTFRARVPASRLATDYTPRLISSHPEAAVPLAAVSNCVTLPTWRVGQTATPSVRNTQPGSPRRIRSLWRRSGWGWNRHGRSSRPSLGARPGVRGTSA